MNRYPESKAVKSIFDPETKTTLSIVHMPGHVYLPAGHFCGYTRFWRFGYTHNGRPVKEPDHHGILTYVPVHGGITFAEEDADGMVYGFDCAHADDEYNPLFQDENWLLQECQLLARGIILAAEYEQFYLLREEDWIRAAVLEEFYEAAEERLGRGFDPTGSLGLMINLICGRL